MKNVVATSRRGPLVLLPALLLTACLLAGPLRRPPPASSAPAQSDPVSVQLQTIRTVYDDLLTTFVRPLQPADLLGPAASALGLTAPPFASDPDTAFDQFATLFRQQAGGASDVAVQAAAFSANKAMAAALQDDHTGFLAPDDFDSLGAYLAGGATKGIGLVLRREGDTLYVAEVGPGGPGEAAGVQAGDIVVAVNGGALAGAPGAPQNGSPPPAGQISLTLRRGGQPFTVTITPATYAFPNWSTAILPGGTGYMRLRAWVNAWQADQDGQTVDQELDQAIAGFESAGVTSWVLDLRDNPGGSGLLVDELAGRFIDGDTLVDRQSNGHGAEAEDLPGGTPLPVQRPLAVLIDERSTSASDMAASVFKESGRAILVGEPTGGQIANAVIWPVGEGAGAEIDFATVHSGVNDTPLDHVGVQPDLTVADRTQADLAAGRDPQLAAAITALQQQPFVTGAPGSNDLVPPGSAAVAAALAPLAPPTAGLAPARAATVQDLGSFPLLSYNDANNWSTATVTTSGSGGGSDAIATREAYRSRGWLGGRVQIYGNGPLDTALWAQWDVYAGASGALAAVAANDFPDQWEPDATAVTLGDDGSATVFDGGWGVQGVFIVRWRRGVTVLTAELQAAPGQGTLSQAVAFAGEIDAAFQAAGGLPLEASLPAR